VFENALLTHTQRQSYLWLTVAGTSGEDWPRTPSASFLPNVISTAPERRETADVLLLAHPSRQSHEPELECASLHCPYRIRPPSPRFGRIMKHYGSPQYSTALQLKLDPVRKVEGEVGTKGSEQAMVVAGQRLFVVSTGNVMAAYSTETGKKEGGLRVPTPILDGPAATNGRLYLTTAGKCRLFRRAVARTIHHSGHFGRRRKNASGHLQRTAPQQ